MPALTQMLKSHLVRRIRARRTDVAPHEVAGAVNTILSTISSALRQGQRVELRGFGTFSPRTWTRPIRNPRTGEVIATAAKRTVRFKPGKAVRDRVNKNR